jgi:NAD(P)H-quinone oxidoreductase subunit N
MLLIGTGQKFIQDLEQKGALGIHVSPEGGSEGHYQRRLRGVGYRVVSMTAKGIGDLSSFFTRIHGMRPPHLGKSDRRTYYFPPLIEQYRSTLPTGSKGLVFWLYEGHVLTQEERSYLLKLSQWDPQVRFVVEVARDRFVHWQSLVP